jgi:hypothetical protein
MGWSSTAMAARYQHITGAIRGGVAERVGRLVWDGAGPKRDQTKETPVRPQRATRRSGWSVAEDAGFEPARVLTPNTISNRAH